MKILFFILLFLTLGSCATQKSVQNNAVVKTSNSFEIDKVTKAIAEKMTLSQNLKNHKRVAIMPLISFDEQKGGKFGEYFADKFTNDLKTKSSSIKLFERKRLEMILKEHSLALTGVISETDAKKLGEFAPIDIIFTGSYTKMKNNIEINCRVLDVVSGEIIETFNSRIALDEELRTLFIKQEKSDVKNITVKIEEKKSDEQICNEKTANLKNHLLDLSTNEKFEAAVLKAKETALFGKCGAIHKTIIKEFLKNNLQSEDYRTFLMSEIENLKAIAIAEMRYRVTYAVDYFFIDNVLDEKEWAIALLILERLSTAHSTYMTTLLKVKEIKESELDTGYKRIDSIMSKAKNKKIGLPVPIVEGKVAYYLITSVKRSIYLTIYAHKNYLNLLSKEDKQRLFSSIKYGYRGIKDKKLRLLFLNTAIDYFNSRQSSDKLGRNIVDFIKELKKDKLRKDELNIFLAKCDKKIAESIPLITYRNNSSLIKLCLETGMTCPLIVPSVQELSKTLLLNDDLRKKEEAASYLALMGDRAVKAEKSTIKVLRYINDKRIKGSVSKLKKECIKILGNIRTKNDKAISLLAAELRNSNSRMTEAAKESIAKIGEAAASAVVEELFKAEKVKVRENIIKALQKMKKDLKKSAPKLKMFLKLSKDEFINDKIEDLLK